jgi:hypothetical protein
MTTTKMQRLWRAGRGRVALLGAAALLAVPGCTDLTETPVSAITPGNFFKNADEVIGGVASVYAGLRGTMWGYYNISQVTTDENVVPTRGSDWFDNGRWLDLHRQAWTPTSGAGLEDIGGMWNDLFGGVARANVVLSALETTDVPNKATIVAEMRALRAFYYYLLMDMFGGVPIVTTTEVKPREQATRAQVFAFIEKELTDARAALPDAWPAESYGRLTKSAADAVLANMYLNARVFTGTVTTSGLTAGPAKWTEAVAAADRVINSGRFQLSANWRSNFAFDNASSRENIMVVRHRAQDGLGLTFVMRMGHYNSFNPSPWNGFATLSDTYFSFDQDDPRRGVFLVGPQVELTTGQPIKDRAGNPLVFTPEIRDITQATEGEGARIYKYTLDPNRQGGENGNDYVYFRLAEMLMIKAEAQNELGQTAAAIALLNQIRTRAGLPAAKLLSTSLTQAQVRDAIYRERLFEFIGEAKRRQDMIRFGTYTAARQFNTTARAPFRILMPIPQNQIETNPLLKQNPGY